jgi:hypothetical protein
MENSIMSFELQESTVSGVVSLIKDDWTRITVNIEIDGVDGELVVSPDVSVFKSKEEQQISLGIDAIDCFEELRESMSQEGEAWTICDLKILNSGKYTYSFSYDEPPRLTKLKNS